MKVNNFEREFLKALYENGIRQIEFIYTKKEVRLSAQCAESCPREILEPMGYIWLSMGQKHFNSIANKGWFEITASGNIKTPISEDLRTILKNIDPEFKYIAKDSNNSINIFKTKPNKLLHIWTNHIEYYNLRAFKHLFKDILSWGDEEPTLIADLIGE